ncbi:MAG: SpoIIE family protein phosphatase [Clostridia bacterium]|nr:SpoIIE family protein phosphatase [Clostridia bacterium]
MLFVTVWMAIVDLSTGKGAAVSAGHEHPVIRPKKRQLRPVHIQARAADIRYGRDPFHGSCL